jgi:two-component system, NarL family, response regulator LiaR
LSGPTRILVVDDHRMFGEALELLLGDEEDLEVLGSVGSAEDALEVAAGNRPDVVLMDIDLPGMDGIEATRQFAERFPGTRVVMITAFQDSAVVAGAIEAGALGYLPKTQAADRLVDVVRRASAGDMVLPAGDIAEVLVRLQESHRTRSDAERVLSQLTSREIHVLQSIGDGKSTNEIAAALFISPLTVQTHVKNILGKLGVHSKLEAVTFALRHGLIRIPGPTATPS